MADREERREGRGVDFNIGNSSNDNDNNIDKIMKKKHCYGTAQGGRQGRDNNK